MSKVNKIYDLNLKISSYLLEIERELDREFRETYSFWDSLFVIDLFFMENEITGLIVKICEMHEEGYFHLNPDGVWSCGDEINSDYKETILKVLNKI